MITNMNMATLFFGRKTRQENMINDVQQREGCLI